MNAVGQDINFWDLVAQTTKVDFENLNTRQTYSTYSIDAYSSWFSRPMLFNQYTSVEDAFNAVKEAYDGDPTNTYFERAKSLLEIVSADSSFNYDKVMESLNVRGPSVNVVEAILFSLKKNLKDIINLGGNCKKQRLIVTSDERGNFDFSLASQGLYRPIEFFRDAYTKSGQDNEFEFTREPFGIIPPDRVFKERNGQNAFYFVAKNGKEYTCERRQKGTTIVFEKLRDKCYLRQNDQGIVLPYSLQTPDKVFNGEKPYRLKYASRNKKVYLQFQRQEESTKYVDIFIPVNLIASDNSSVKLFNTLMPIMVASALQEFGIQVRISAVRNGNRDDSLPFQTASVVLKDYTESMDEKVPLIINLLTKRDFQQYFFGALLNVQGDEGKQTDASGQPIYARDKAILMDRLLYNSKDGMVNLFMRYKNWVNANVGKPYVNTKVKNQNFQFLTHIRNENDFYTSEKATPAVIATQLPYLMYEFYWHMDYLAIEFVPIPQFVASLFTRFEEDENFRKLYDVPSRSRVKNIIREYVANILTYKYYSTTSGSFADSIDEMKQKNDTMERITEELKEALKKY